MDGHDQVQTISVTGTAGSKPVPRHAGAAGADGVRRRVRPRRRVGAVRRFVSTVGAIALTAGTLVSVPLLAAAPASAAETNSISIHLTAARTQPHATPPVTEGQSVPEFRYLINVDNSGKGEPAGGPQPGSGCSAEDPGYPKDCSWASILEDPGAAPIYRQGTSADFAGGARLDLPDGDYLVSVLADGYKIDGAHFTVPMADPGVGRGRASARPPARLDAARTGLRRRRAHERRHRHRRDRPHRAGPPLPGPHQRHPRRGHAPTSTATRCARRTSARTRTPTRSRGLDLADADMLPVVDTIGGKCVSDADRHAHHPAPRHQPLHARTSPRPTAAAGSRRRPSRATTTGTPG